MKWSIQIMIVTLSTVVMTLFLFLPLCVCKKKAKFEKLEKFTEKIEPQYSNVNEIQQLEVENTQSTITSTELLQKSPMEEVEIIAEIEKQSEKKEKGSKENKDMEIGESKLESVEETQYSQSGSMQNVEEITEKEKETFEVSPSQETSSPGTLQYVQPRVRFFERTNEITRCKPIDKQRNEYKTLMFIDEDKNLTTENIYPRNVRQQDITEYKIEKYTVIGYKMPEILEEHTCRDDDF
ncbi:DNA-directed RNA polymerase subunit beta' [Dirofilaria immitis]